MTNRTLKFLGRGYTADSLEAEITVIFDGNTVFEGPVPTVYQTAVLPPEFQVVHEDLIDMFTTDVDLKFAGTKPVKIICTRGTFVLGNILGNYVPYIDTIADQLVTSGAESFVILGGNGSGEPKSAIKINNVAAEFIRRDGQNGQWFLDVHQGQVLDFDLLLDPGVTPDEIE